MSRRIRHRRHQSQARYMNRHHLCRLEYRLSLEDRCPHHSWLSHLRQSIRHHHRQYRRCFQFRHRQCQSTQLSLEGSHRMSRRIRRHRRLYRHCFQFRQHQCLTTRCSCSGMRRLRLVLRHRHRRCLPSPRDHRCHRPHQRCGRSHHRQHPTAQSSLAGSRLDRLYKRLCQLLQCRKYHHRHRLCRRCFLFRHCQCPTTLLHHSRMHQPS